MKKILGLLFVGVALVGCAGPAEGDPNPPKEAAPSVTTPETPPKTETPAPTTP